jgi:hypothetical protein
LAEREIYTLYNGMEVQLPAGLSDTEAENLIAKALPSVAFGKGVAYDVSEEYDMRSSVDNAGLRFDLALAKDNPKEAKAVMDARLGKDGWGLSDFGEFYANPIGLRRLGMEPKDNRKVLIDGIENNVYDLVDLVPEIATGVGALAAELLIPVPGTGAAGAAAVGGFLSSFTARQLVARSIAGGAGDVTANLGLEAIQTYRGNQYEDLGEILSDAGTQGAVVAAASLGLGLPFTAIGPVAGKIKNVAKENIDNVTTNRGIAVTAESAKQARQEAVDFLRAQGVPENEIQDIVPLITLKHQLGDSGNLFAKFAIVSEGAGAKNLADSLPAKGLEFLDKIDSFFRQGQAAGKTPAQIAQELKASLNKAELQTAKNIQKEIDTAYKQMSKTSVQRDRAEIGDLIELQANNQLRYMMKNFDESPELYASPDLDLDNLYKTTVDNDLVADLVNNLSKEYTRSAEDVISILNKTSNGLGTKLQKVIDIEDGFAVAKKADDAASDVVSQLGLGKQFADDLAAFTNRSSKEAEKQIASITARDLYELDRSIRQNIYKGRLDRNGIREGVIASKEILDTMDNIVSPDFSTTFRQVNADYKKAITPFAKGLGKFENSTAQTVPEYVKDLVTGRKTQVFAELVETLDDMLTGIEKAGGKAANVMSADEVLGEVATQYMRYHRDRFNLTTAKLSTDDIPTLRQNAKEALKQIDDLKNRETTPRAKKAFNRLFNNQAFTEYRKALENLSKGNVRAAEKLKMQLSYEEAGQFVDNIAKLGRNLRDADLDTAVEQYRAIKAIEPRGTDFYNLMLYSEIFDRVKKIAGQNPQTRNQALKGWADDIVSANNVSPAALKELLGGGKEGTKDLYKPLMQMANVIQGGFNLDPTAGAISAAGQPLMGLRGLINFSAGAALKPVVFMGMLKSYAPGGRSWKAINAAINGGQSIEQVAKNSNLNKNAQIALKAANYSAAKILAGRDGLFAASVAAYMNEADERLPNENTPVVPVRQRTGAEVEAERQAEQQQQQQSMVPTDTGLAAIQKIASMIQGVGTSGLKEGADIARSVA